jgi:hypothetical protein
MSAPARRAEPSLADVTDQVSAIVLQRPTGKTWLLAFALALALTALLVAGISYLLVKGVGIWGVDMPVAWAFAIADYVWWIAIGMAGTFISAALYLARQEWRTSLNRYAEAMTVFAVSVSGIFRSCIWGGRGSSTGWRRTPTGWICGRSGAVRCCGISSRSWPI